jgi:hypothetical protein
MGLRFRSTISRALSSTVFSYFSFIRTSYICGGPHRSQTNLDIIKLPSLSFISTVFHLCGGQLPDATGALDDDRLNTITKNTITIITAINHFPRPHQQYLVLLHRCIWPYHHPDYLTWQRSHQSAQFCTGCLAD